MVILLVIAVIFLVLVAGFLLAFLFLRLDRTVTTTRAEMAAEERAYNPGLTLGHKIKMASDYDEQMQQARLEAAKTAAALPRGANNRVGRLGQSNLSTAGKSAGTDPVTAVRIARFHGWDGARTGIPAGGIPAGGVAPAVAAAPVAAGAVAPAAAGIAPPTLIAITADMPPEEVRKARVANAKAESAYNKALKAAASGATAAAPAAPVAAVGPVAAPAAAPMVSIAPPQLIEITPGMPPEEVRKARVANAKAESAYNKALKAAGATVGAAVAQPVAAPAQPVAAAAAPVAPAAAVGIAPPQLIEITDSMPPDEIRRARVANAKAESAYNKALKAAGIDPASLKGGTPVAPVAAAPVAEVAAPVAEPIAAPVGLPAAAAGIAPPQLIEITADMPADEVRQARVANAKAQSAYNKALKAAGIDPASLK